MPNENCSISIEGTQMGEACGSGCTQCPTDFDEGLSATIDVNSYCSDTKLKVSFSDSDTVGDTCNSVHKACVYYDGNWYCLDKECDTGGCDNFVEFDCDTWNPITTTTTIPTEFIVSKFDCVEITGGHRCSIRYDNQLGEDAVLVTLYTNSQGRVVNAPSPSVGTGSGEMSSNFYCSGFESGTYQVSWRVYRETDQTLSDPIAWCKSDEVQEVNC